VELPSFLGASAAADLAPPPISGERGPRPFAERTVLAAAAVIAEDARAAAEAAAGRGPLQRLDPRAKLLGALALLVAVAATRSLGALAAVAALAPALAAWSHLDARRLARDAWTFVPLFTAAIALPACLAAVTPGTPLLGSGALAVTREGALAAATLVLRAGASVSLALLLARSTGAPALLDALRGLGAPAGLAVVAGLAHRWLLVLAREVEEMHLGLLSRRIGAWRAREGRAFVTSRIGVLLARTQRTAGEVHLAMRARGFDGVWRMLPRPAPGARDALAVAIAASLAVLVVLAPGLGVP
jgi:cobalt ECF transporter T component CbiQ